MASRIDSRLSGTPFSRVVLTSGLALLRLMTEVMSVRMGCNRGPMLDSRELTSGRTTCLIIGERPCRVSVLMSRIVPIKLVSSCSDVARALMSR